MPERVLRMGMIGGGRDAFIGAVHRMAARLDGTAELVAGCLASTPDKALASGRDLGLADERNYPTWQAMLDGERSLPRDQRIDFVTIVTPNHLHFPIADAFAAAGIHVICDKPLVLSSDEARRLGTTVKKSGIVFCVTYNYSGYPLIKQAREMVSAGELGDIRKVIVEYSQGWLASALEKSGQKQADWRTDPARTGLGGAIGDIGSHAEQLVSYVTGLKIESICADLTSFVKGRAVDDDANLLLRFQGGAKGILSASQICIGHENDLSLRIYGTKASLLWRQEDPNQLAFRPDGQPERIYRRGNAYLDPPAKAATRLPSGHPEAFIEAFANIYKAAAADIRAGKPSPTHDYPDLTDGARGVHFIEKTVESSRSERKWTDARWAGL